MSAHLTAADIEICRMEIERADIRLGVFNWAWALGSALDEIEQLKTEVAHHGPAPLPGSSDQVTAVDLLHTCSTCNSVAPHLVDCLTCGHRHELPDKRVNRAVQSPPLASENDDWTGDPVEDRRRLVERVQDQLRNRSW